jgi:hypothetical protein
VIWRIIMFKPRQSKVNFTILLRGEKKWCSSKKTRKRKKAKKKWKKMNGKHVLLGSVTSTVDGLLLCGCYFSVNEALCTLQLSDFPF